MDGETIKVRRSEFNNIHQAAAVKVMKNVLSKITTNDKSQIMVPEELLEYGDENVQSNQNVNKLTGNKVPKDGFIEFHQNYLLPHREFKMILKEHDETSEPKELKEKRKFEHIDEVEKEIIKKTDFVNVPPVIEQQEENKTELWDHEAKKRKLLWDIDPQETLSLKQKYSYKNLPPVKKETPMDRYLRMMKRKEIKFSSFFILCLKYF